MSSSSQAVVAVGSVSFGPVIVGSSTAGRAEQVEAVAPHVGSGIEILVSGAPRTLLPPVAWNKARLSSDQGLR